MNSTHQESAWQISGEQKRGPCPENWIPLLPQNQNNFAVLQKCVAHVDMTLLSPKVTNLDAAINACSYALGNSTTATIFRPDDRRELKDFLDIAATEKLQGFFDIFVEDGAPKDHESNDLRHLGEEVSELVSKGSEGDCAWNLPESGTTFQKCDSFSTIWCQYKAKALLTEYSCDGWFKADHGSQVNCYYVHRLLTSARNARNICRKKKAALVTMSNLAEWSYISRLASALVPRTEDRMLFLGYTRCGTNPPEWREMEGGIPSKIIPFPNASTIPDAECCLEMNVDNRMKGE